MSERSHSHRDLHVYQNARNAAMEFFNLSKSFPSEETFTRMNAEYDRILGQLVRMIDGADNWIIK